MVEVSDKFKQLACENGRRVWCRIIADGEEFLDDRVLEFSFDDVTHPDWYTIGTACANRFHFRARADITLSVGAQVRPYVSFDGEEWCPLGVFYISRRYVRGKVISVTAYDRMYGLDMEYSFSGTLPTDASSLLKAICTENEIDAAEYGHAYPIDSLPQQPCTVRDMIGYIAALNRACAKFGRDGTLQLKRCNEQDYFIYDRNCMDIRRDMEPSHVTCIKAQTENGEIVSGSGSELNTLEVYSPLMKQYIADSMCGIYKAFSFYGADVEMQGMPFLESGEAVYLVEGRQFYPIIISEVEYYYNGGLTATLYSRNKTRVDAVVHEDDLEAALDQITASLQAICMKQENTEDITVGAEPVIIADFTFSSKTAGFAELAADITLTGGTAERISFNVIVNGADSGRVISHSPTAGDNLLHVYQLEPQLSAGENRIYLAVSAEGGEAVVPARGISAGLVVHGSAFTATSDPKDKLTFFEITEPVRTDYSKFRMAAATDSAQLLS